ncbi:hypothetical protein KL905_000897 [Ogataea polymorpha]|uniref:GPN-loop GTPase 2 n=1 Tax=Ogataea polymorpha TaxID=460523 RepID=A0A9P8TD58_9ASCO|nr:hypothetical protein KL937_001240 [Ogataea polymorpha]KAG7890763.1 hypothetical protein KL936_002047 [Ogataea polymorpha]KAG7893909.1 hypothetical protein KL908_002186 [Ogataea polymorpha]KAG7901863.1 hypothetical protein KL935_001823 [Ogataea polymorpha]KAG7910381.1 hypothetical protein KL907_001272 [Ogataea polymorpha]
MPPYGQIVIGPPGAGKSTYCNGMNQFLNSIGRNSLIVNLDPANDLLPYHCTIDIRDFITLEEIMNDENIRLGPNGGLVYCLEVFEQSIQYFIEKIKDLMSLSLDGQSTYIIFDCPGQTELFTNNPIFRKIFSKLEKELDFRFCVVSLVDSINLVTPSYYISMLLLTLRSMLQMDLPQVNVISKIDLLKSYIDGDRASKMEQRKRQETDEDDLEGGLPFRLQYYTEVQDLNQLLPYVRTENNQRGYFNEKYERLTTLIADLIEDFGLIQYTVLAIEDKISMINLLSIIDKANGYCFGTNELGGDSIWSDAVRQSSLAFMEDIDIHERWIDEKEQWDELEEEKRNELEEYFQNIQAKQDPEDEWEAALRDWEMKQDIETKRA